MNCRSEKGTWRVMIAVAALTVCLLPGGVSAEGFGSDLHFYGIGATGALAHPSDIGSAMGLAIHADLGEIYPGLVLFPEISYWSRSEEVGVAGFFSSKMKLSELGFQANAHYYLNPEARLNYYVGFGAGLYTHKAKVESSSSGIGRDFSSESSFGINLLGGLESPLSPNTRLIGELRYKIDGQQNVFRAGMGVSVYL